MVSEGACEVISTPSSSLIYAYIIAILVTRTIALWNFNTYVKIFAICAYVEITVSASVGPSR